jgi:hypothetical protein
VVTRQTDGAVFDTEPSIMWSLWDVNADGSGLRRVIPDCFDGEFFEPLIGRWLPSTRNFVFVAGSGAARGIRALPATGARATTPVQVTSGPVEFRGLTPSPDGAGFTPSVGSGAANLCDTTS